MKVFILLSLIAATFSPGDPPRKAAKIEIITTQSDTANYLRIKRYLSEMSIPIDQSDSEIHTIQTARIQGKFSNTLVFLFSCQGHSVFITGYYYNRFLGSSTFLGSHDSSRIKNTGMKGSMDNRAWSDMHTISLNIAGRDSVAYHLQ